MDNLPLGCSNFEFGAPFNDIEYDCIFVVHCSTSFNGPLSHNDLKDQIDDFTSEIKKRIMKIDGVDEVIKE